MINKYKKGGIIKGYDDFKGKGVLIGLKYMETSVVSGNVLVLDLRWLQGFALHNSPSN